MGRIVICNKCEKKFACPKELKKEYDSFVDPIPKKDQDKIEFCVDPAWCSKCSPPEKK